VRVDSTLGRVVQRVAGSRPFAAVAPKVVPPLDRVVHRLTGGRVIISEGLLPGLMLTTTGRKSGRPRTVPLATLPDGESLVVVASNFGRPDHPAWSTNLMHHPQATVTYRRQTFAVEAHLLTPEEKTEMWPKLTAMWPVYDRYVERSKRDLRVFRLERSGSTLA
jgi:deazaflavin-dependent oxidoreductase (nitroreductase family)